MRYLAAGCLLAGLSILSALDPLGAQHGTSTPDAACEDATVRCASFAAPAFDGSGRLWVVWSGAGYVGVSPSRDGGKTLDRPVLVNSKPLRMDTGADSRPQLVFDRNGAAVVAFTIRKDDQFNGQVLIARATRPGGSFAAPVPVSDNAASQRFVSLATDPKGRIFATWIDKRREGPAAGLPSSEGASVAYAWSDDGGRTFGSAALAHTGMCECCRLAVALTADGRPVVAFRDVREGVRDHAIVEFSSQGKPKPIVPALSDQWEITGCPHHGPSLAIGGDGTLHFAWFTDGNLRKGAFYAQSRDGGRAWSTPMALSSSSAVRAQRPYVAVSGSSVWIAWKVQDGGTARVFTRRSPDGGRTWAQPAEVASSQSSSDHPLLAVNNGRPYLSWLTRAEGYRLIALTP